MAHRIFVVAFAAALFMSPGPAAAQTQDADALGVARELVALTVGDNLQDRLVDQTWPALEPVIRTAAPQLTPEQMAGLKAEYVKLTVEDMRSMMADVPAVYAKYFSAQELRDILVFYRTPAGKKTIETMPALSGEIMKIVIPKLPDMMKRMNEAFTRVLQEKGISIPSPQ